MCFFFVLLNLMHFLFYISEVNPDFDLYFHGNSRIDTGVKRIKNRNQFSVCLWYKAFGLMSSMPVLTLVAVNG